MSDPNGLAGRTPHGTELHTIESAPSRQASVSTNAEEVSGDHGQHNSPMASQQRVRFSTEITPSSPRNSTSAYHTRRSPGGLEIDVERIRVEEEDTGRLRSPKSPLSPGRSRAFSLR